MALYEVMKCCNLGDQSQFETSNLNSHWINTNDTPWLDFSMLHFNWKKPNGDS